MFSPSIHTYIHPSITPHPNTCSLSLTLISLLVLWFVSLVSVRTVITAVSSLGENKVVLCSQHHKRHKRNKRKEPQLKKEKKKEAERREKIKKEGSEPEERKGLGTHLFMSTMMHCHLWVITTIDFFLCHPFYLYSTKLTVGWKI